MNTTTTPIYYRQIGSLPKSKKLRELLQDRAEGRQHDAVLLEELCLSTMSENVARQIKLDSPLVVSGEPDRESFFHHIYDSLSGLERLPTPLVFVPAELTDYPDVWEAIVTPAWQHIPSWRCSGPIMEKDPDAIYRELALFKRALKLNEWPPERAIWTEPAPWVVAGGIDGTSPYTTRREFAQALGQVMRRRYQAVNQERFILSVDIPNALMRHVAPVLPLEQFLELSAMQIEVLNEALDGLPLERVHAHSCYGNYRGPDTRDEALASLAPPLLKARVGTLFLEGSVSRHREDYLALRELLDADMVPATLTFGIGVIDTKSLSVEGEQEVAHRIVAMRQALGKRLAAVSPDCGYETVTGVENITPSLVWAKNDVLRKAVALANSSIAQMEAWDSLTPMY